MRGNQSFGRCLDYCLRRLGSFLSQPPPRLVVPLEILPQNFSMDLFKVLFPCFPTSGRERSIQLPTGTANFQHISEKAAVQPFSRSVNEPDICSDKAALSIVSAMLDADKAGPSLDTTIQSLVHQAGGWSQYLAEKILAAIEAVLKSGKQMNAAMQEACDKACEAAKMIEGFAADHPFATTVFCTVIALGVLVVLAPYALEWLGFSELGPIEGKSHCQSRVRCEV